ATGVFWRPQLCLLVNEATLLRVLVPLAPVATVAERFFKALTDVLVAHGVTGQFIATEQVAMAQVRWPRIKPQRGRDHERVAFLAEAYTGSHAQPDFAEPSIRLAKTSCGPLYKRHVSSDRELADFLSEHPLAETKHSTRPISRTATAGCTRERYIRLRTQ